MLDPDEGEPDEFDLGGLECPRCRASDIDILRYPPRGSELRGCWWTAAGEARCVMCGLIFGVNPIEEASP